MSNELNSASGKTDKLHGTAVGLIVVAFFGGVALGWVGGQTKPTVARMAVMDYARSQCEFRNLAAQVAGSPQLQMNCERLFPRGVVPAPVLKALLAAPTP